MKKGTIVTLYFYDDKGDELYAECGFIGTNRNGEYRFRSVIYGWIYLVSKDLETVTDYQNRTYKANTDRAWAYCLKSDMDLTGKGEDVRQTADNGNVMNFPDSEKSICSFQKCLSCSLTGCWTGQVAREKGIAGYNAFIKMLDEAEENALSDGKLDAEEHAIY